MVSLQSVARGSRTVGQQFDTPLRTHLAENATSAFAAWSSWTISSLLGSLTWEKKRYYVTVLGKMEGELGKKVLVNETTASYRGPVWLINRAWSLQARQASFGWTFRPRAYHVVPNDSLVFVYAEQDNVQGLQDLFSKREASPFDCNEDNETPLHVRIDINLATHLLNIVIQKAAYSYSYCARRLLIEHGADANCQIAEEVA